MNSACLIQQIGAQQIAYLDPNPAGSPLVLLLHGLGADGSSWTYQIDALHAAGMRPMAVDLPGFGKSPRPDGRWSVRAAAGGIYSFLESITKQPVFIAGLSMGGAVAQQIALDHPAAVRGLLLLDTFANLRPKRVNETFYLVRRFIAATVKGVGFQAEIVAQRLFPGAEQAELREELRKRILEADPQVYRQAMLELGLFNSRPRLHEFQVPVLVLSAENDTTVPLENQDELAQGIPQARRVIIPNARHAVIIDQPELVNRAMIEFIQENL